MLVLSRKVNEQIVIGDNIRVTVVSIRGNQIRLGFEAPDVLIFRDELRPGQPFTTLRRVRRRDPRGGRLCHSSAREQSRLSPLNRGWPLQGNAVGDETKPESRPRLPCPSALESQFVEII